MREYEDPQQFFETHVEQAVEEFVDRFGRSGLKPNTTIAKAMAERIVNEVEDRYLEHAAEIHDHNLNVILQDHTTRMNKIKREGASLRLKMCPPIALLFGLMAWYSFSNPGGFIVGMLYVVGALAFLAMLLLGALFDRPRRI